MPRRHLRLHCLRDLGRNIHLLRIRDNSLLAGTTKVTFQYFKGKISIRKLPIGGVQLGIGIDLSGKARRAEYNAPGTPS